MDGDASQLAGPRRVRALARDPGGVMSAAEIRAATPSWTDVDDHAVEMAVSLCAPSATQIVQTIARVIDSPAEASRLQNRYLEPLKPDSPDGQGLHETTTGNSNRAV